MAVVFQQECRVPGEPAAILSRKLPTPRSGGPRGNNGYNLCSCASLQEFLIKLRERISKFVVRSPALRFRASSGARIKFPQHLLINCMWLDGHQRVHGWPDCADQVCVWPPAWCFVWSQQWDTQRTSTCRPQNLLVLVFAVPVAHVSRVMSTPSFAATHSDQGLYRMFYKQVQADDR